MRLCQPQLSNMGCFVANALLAIGIQLFHLFNGAQGNHASPLIVAEAWQSSVFEERCFLASVRAASDTASLRFRLGDAPDDSGYQWLLLRLAEAVRLQSVTVLAESEDRSAASNLEVLISDRLSSELQPASGTCRATFARVDQLSEFATCGRTAAEGFGPLHQDVECRIKCGSLCPRLTQYILLRRFVQSETNKVMKFAGLKINIGKNAVQVLRFSGGGKSSCSAVGLDRLRPGSSTTLVACLPCTTSENPKCSIQPSPNNFVTVRRSRTLGGQTAFRLEFTGQFRNSKLDCSYQCSDGTTGRFKRTVGFISKPKAVHLSFGSQYWMVGTKALFTFDTEPAFPQPLHRCQLIRQGLPIKTLAAQEDKLTDFGSGLQFRNSTYSLTVDESLRDGSILCVSTLANTSEEAKKPERLPELIYPCKTQFSQPPETDCKISTMLNFTVSTSIGSHGIQCPAVTHDCCLQHKLGCTSLTPVSRSRTSSKFSLTVRCEWVDSASVKCLVDHSGLLQESVSSTLCRRALQVQEKPGDLSLKHFLTSFVLCSLLAISGIAASVGVLCCRRDQKPVACDTPVGGNNHFYSMSLLSQKSLAEAATLKQPSRAVDYYQLATAVTAMNRPEDEYDLLATAVTATHRAEVDEDEYDLLATAVTATHRPEVDEDEYDLLSTAVTATHRPEVDEDEYDLMTTAVTATHRPEVDEDEYDLLETAINRPEVDDNGFEQLETTVNLAYLWRN